VQVPDRLQTFTNETGQELTFGNFIRHHDYEPERLLVQETWTAWKAKAQLAPAPSDPDLDWLKRSLVRAAFISGPGEIGRLRRIIGRLASGDVPGALELAGDQANAVYYRLWGDKAERFGFADLSDAFHRLTENPSILRDMDEILAWARDVSPVAGVVPDLPFPCSLEVHAQFSVTDILAAFDRATLASAGQRGTGVLHFKDIKAYALLITFQKTEKEFSPTTMYADYPISRELLPLGVSIQHGPGFAHGAEPGASPGSGIYHPGVCPAEEKAQQLHGAVCVFRAGQACEPSKGAAHPDGVGAELSHARGAV
jgi:hypothetical protein